MKRQAWKRPSPLVSSQKQQTGFQSGQKRLKWSVPTIVILGLVAMILVIPTIIVVPFISKGEVLSQSIDREPQDQEQVQEDDSAVEVAVMRSQTSQIENVPLETYVTRVVAGEMPVEFEFEALKAQALAARTYIVNQMLYQTEEASSNVSDTIQDQVYRDDVELREKWGKNYQKNLDKITEAVLATKGQIITYNNKPITPQFFSTSNGFTENSEDYWTNKIPYLRSVPSPWDEVSPYYLDQETFTIEEVEKALGIDLPTNEKLSIEATRTKSKRVGELNLAGNNFTGREIREKLKLRSNDFTIEQKNNYLIFTTKGNGHGVGMSQYGANGMAQEGKKYDEIIKYYYKDVEISNMDEAVPALVMK
jgi:stage II sporulation protein D